MKSSRDSERITRPIASTLQWRLRPPVLLQGGIVEMQLESLHRVLITGPPLQNNLETALHKHNCVGKYVIAMVYFSI